jgi:hypothetical protein
MFNFTRNEERSQYEANFSGVLQTISPEPVGQFPSGKNYHVASVKFKNAKGQDTIVQALVNAANFNYGMELGKSYLCQAIIKDGQSTPLITCSHLEGTAPRATLDDFGFNAAKIAASVPQEESVNLLA